MERSLRLAPMAAGKWNGRFRPVWKGNVTPVSRRSLLTVLVAKACLAADPVPVLTAGARQAFRTWFCYIAETAYYRERLPPEINDCAALVRYAFREALKPHTPEWKRLFAAPRPFDAPDVSGFRIPAGGLFSTGRGRADFADALTLRQHNCGCEGREAERAEPADLLFFYQPGSRYPFHLMIFLGRSAYGDAGADWIVYHTGDSQGVKKVSRNVLARHPDPRWRPVPANPAFLGYYRLNLLR